MKNDERDASVTLDVGVVSQMIDRLNNRTRNCAIHFVSWKQKRLNYEQDSEPCESMQGIEVAVGSYRTWRSIVLFLTDVNRSMVVLSPVLLTFRCFRTLLLIPIPG
jgi:hypothetical protein